MGGHGKLLEVAVPIDPSVSDMMASQIPKHQCASATVFAIGELRPKVSTKFTRTSWPLARGPQPLRKAVPQCMRLKDWDSVRNYLEVCGYEIIMLRLLVQNSLD